MGVESQIQTKAETDNLSEMKSERQSAVSIDLEVERWKNIRRVSKDQYDNSTVTLTGAYWAVVILMFM